MMISNRVAKPGNPRGSYNDGIKVIRLGGSFSIPLGINGSISRSGIDRNSGGWVERHIMGMMGRRTTRTPPHVEKEARWRVGGLASPSLRAPPLLQTLWAGGRHPVGGLRCTRAGCVCECCLAVRPVV